MIHEDEDFGAQRDYKSERDTLKEENEKLRKQILKITEDE